MQSPCHARPRSLPILAFTVLKLGREVVGLGRKIRGSRMERLEWCSPTQLRRSFQKKLSKSIKQLPYVMARLTFLFRVQLQWFGRRIYKQDRWQELGEGFHTLFNWVLSWLFMHQILKFSFSPAFASISLATFYLQNLEQMIVSHTFCHISWWITILGSSGNISFQLQQSLHAVTVSTFRCKVQRCETCRVWGWWWCLMIH